MPAQQSEGALLSQVSTLPARGMQHATQALPSFVLVAQKRTGEAPCQHGPQQVAHERHEQQQTPEEVGRAAHAPFMEKQIEPAGTGASREPPGEQARLAAQLAAQ